MNNKKIKSTTQDHLDIADIRDNLVVLNDGGAVVILETTAINFDLLSVLEQDAAIAAYSSLLNSLSFPIQVTIRSKRIDISEYLEKVKDIEDKQQNPKIRDQIKKYRSFIQDELITKENVLDKNFYVTIPYKIFEIGSSANPFASLFGFSGSSNKQRINVDKILQEATADLEPKKNFIIKEFARIGIKAKQLNTTELIKLFYEIYNSETAQSQKLRGNVEDYTSALVEPKIA
ncbi:hypothetical protein CO058_03395 [candidate division WWE3 bacterium CG_4_9_14_0_2_um_filter_35_11]|uniref:TraC-like domain-containing protein n=1 Tax=candidate division WWE3 bacterium CG_4_9_14_0_2_um_filter_35_11 TaxID=1975077 RepID=A0A2M8EL32_UNCKA|nr:MAG: hypothetical protein COV25_00790 [candidate division WWE3 bacterium CG10_big_fil_rev_8_21_14_0_10_35_32]PJC23452.1 MAG: hypothetical protein CO058_03395 [candidate division WWE3 bacterium CG_4_9_14_0_2_um_filter_35_11]